MRTNETMLFDALFQHLQRLAQKIAARTNPKLRVVSCGFDPINLVQVKDSCSARSRDHDSFFACRARSGSQTLFEAFHRRCKTRFTHRLDEVIECFGFEGANRELIESS